MKLNEYVPNIQKFLIHWKLLRSEFPRHCSPAHPTLPPRRSPAYYVNEDVNSSTEFRSSVHKVLQKICCLFPWGQLDLFERLWQAPCNPSTMCFVAVSRSWLSGGSHRAPAGFNETAERGGDRDRDANMFSSPRYLLSRAHMASSASGSCSPIR